MHVGGAFSGQRARLGFRPSENSHLQKPRLRLVDKADQGALDPHHTGHAEGGVPEGRWWLWTGGGAAGQRQLRGSHPVPQLRERGPRSL